MANEVDKVQSGSGLQHYQVNTVILEGRHLPASNANTKIVITIGNRRKTFRSRSKKTDSPYFNELCIFNFYDTLNSFLDIMLKISVFRAPTVGRNKLIGSVSMDMATVWEQPNQTFYHKWAALTNPKNPAAGIRGYLKCDISIISRGNKTLPVDYDSGEVIEDNLLVPYGEINTRQRAKFVFSVFRADNFAEFSDSKIRSLYSFVRITYAGITSKTSVAKNTNNPSWNEELSFVEMIPALYRYIHVEVCDALKASSRGIIGTANLDMMQLSHEGENGFLPTYGPCFLYVYQRIGNVNKTLKCSNSAYTYACRLLIALRTEVVDYAEDVLVRKKDSTSTKPKSIPSLEEEKYFTQSEFIFFAAVFDILLFDDSLLNSKVSIRANIGPAFILDMEQMKTDNRITRKEEEDVEKSSTGGESPKVATDDGIDTEEQTGSKEKSSNKWKTFRHDSKRLMPTTLSLWFTTRRGPFQSNDKQRPVKEQSKWVRRLSVRDWKMLRSLRYWPTEWRHFRLKSMKAKPKESQTESKTKTNSTGEINPSSVSIHKASTNSKRESLKVMSRTETADNSAVNRRRIDISWRRLIRRRKSGSKGLKGSAEKNDQKVNSRIEGHDADPAYKDPDDWFSTSALGKKEKTLQSKVIKQNSNISMINVKDNNGEVSNDKSSDGKGGSEKQSNSSFSENAFKNVKPENLQILPMSKHKMQKEKKGKRRKMKSKKVQVNRSEESAEDVYELLQSISDDIISPKGSWTGSFDSRTFNSHNLNKKKREKGKGKKSKNKRKPGNKFQGSSMAKTSNTTNTYLAMVPMKKNHFRTYKRSEDDPADESEVSWWQDEESENRKKNLKNNMEKSYSVSYDSEPTTTDLDNIVRKKREWSTKGNIEKDYDTNNRDKLNRSRHLKLKNRHSPQTRTHANVMYYIEAKGGGGETFSIMTPQPSKTNEVTNGTSAEWKHTKEENNQIFNEVVPDGSNDIPEKTENDMPEEDKKVGEKDENNEKRAGELKKKKFWNKKSKKPKRTSNIIEGNEFSQHGSNYRSENIGNKQSKEETEVVEENLQSNKSDANMEKKRAKKIKKMNKKIMKKRKKGKYFKKKSTVILEEEEKDGDSDRKEKKEVEHVKIYNGCNTTAPVRVTVKGSFAYSSMSGRYPCLHINGLWPNAARRMYRTNTMQKAISRFTEGINEVEDCIKREDMMAASEKLKKVFQVLSEDCKTMISLTMKVEKNDTNLYRERKRYFHGEIKNIAYAAEAAAQRKLLLAKDELIRAREYLSTLKRFELDPEDSFPDIEIWLLKDGINLAQHRVKTGQIAHSQNDWESGSASGRIQSVMIRGKDGELIAKLEILMWFGFSVQFPQCTNKLPPGYEQERHDCPGTNLSNIPRTLIYQEAHRFSCKVYLFQAIILKAFDSNGLADPFVRVIGLGEYRESQIQKETLNPMWNEMLLFPVVTMCGSANFIKDNPITLTVEVIDYDFLSKNELMGRALLKPVVKLTNDAYDPPNFPPKPKWEDILLQCEETGKILLAAELLEVKEGEESDITTSTKQKMIPIPKIITPHSVGYRLEVLFWGIREMRKTTLKRAYVTLEFGGKHLRSSTLKNISKSLNFPAMVQTLDLELPEQHEYKPPLIMKLYQTNPFGKETYAGNCIIPSAQIFFCPTVDDEEMKKKATEYQQILKELLRAKKAAKAEREAKAETEKRKHRWRRMHRKFMDLLENIAFVFVRLYQKIKCRIKGSCVDIEKSKLQEEEEILDWWVKYYASKGEGDQDVESFVIYQEELEAQPEFHGFSDYIYTFNMTTGRTRRHIEQQVMVGKVKAAIKLYRWPVDETHFKTLNGVNIQRGVLKQLPSNVAIKYVLRVYVICCKNLTPRDVTGKSDPYLILMLGKQRINDVKNYIPKQVNPIFGKCFEFKGIFPKEHLLRIKVMDHDRLSEDDLIGETVIDLESRYYTRHHASCGIPKTYRRRGYAAWRDAFRPTEILKVACRVSNMDVPEYTEMGVRIGEYEFRANYVNEKYKEESHALEALRRWQEIPLRGFHHVPEHVETRALYHPSFPGVEQGKLEMWADIFPADFRYLPPVVDVEPRKPARMELRAIIWNVEDVILDDTSLFFKERMSDIYVKGWLSAQEEDTQSTDVHYRSMNGEGNFNWRFVFPFSYISTERRLVVHKKLTAFDLEPEEIKFPCRLELQVWDNDFFADDFLGSLNLELSSMPHGAKISTRCTLNMFDEDMPRVNLFQIRRTRGWWPFRKVTDPESSEYMLTGKVDLELEVLTEREANESPVGKGREEPKALPFPKRPESSFIWFLHPWKTFRYIIFKKYRTYIIMFLLVAMLTIFVLLGVYAFPGYVAKRIVGA